MPSADTQDYLWIAVGDIHDDPACFHRIPELAQADGIIVTGDLTITGGVKQAELVMEVLRAHDLPVWAQIGNMDRPEVDAWLSEQGWNLHTVTRELTPDTAIFGVGASTFTPFGTPSEFPESTFAAWLEACWQRARLLPPRPVLKAAGSEGRAALLAYFHKRRIIEQINSEMSQFQSFEDARSGTSQRK